MNNNKYGEEIVNRYIYDVTRRLSYDIREDIDRELRSLIDDMLGGKMESARREDIDRVLIELGRPSELADKYRDKKLHIIGPQLYDTYIMVLKIALGAVTLGLIIANIVSLIANPTITFATFGMLMGSIFSGLIQAFGFVTIIFIIIERYGNDFKKITIESWSLKDLPEVPNRSNKINRIEPIIGLIFSFIFISIININHDIIGIYVFSNGLTIVPIFNSGVFVTMLPLFNIIIGLGIIKEFSKLITGKYNLPVAIITTAANLLSIIFVIIIFSNSNIWNADLVNALNNIEGYVPADINVNTIFMYVRRFFLLIIIVPLIIDILNVTIRYIKNKLIT